MPDIIIQLFQPGHSIYSLEGSIDSTFIVEEDFSSR